MDAFGCVTAIHAMALAMAREMTPDELNRAALLFTQLGTTLATLAGMQDLADGGSARSVESDQK